MESGLKKLIDVASPLVCGVSACDPLVRAMAVWALSRLLAPAAFARLRARSLEGESDAAVRAEWGA